MVIRLGIGVITGRMGQSVLAAARDDARFQVIGGMSRQELTVAAPGTDLVTARDPGSLMELVDVVIDV